ncbi:MAG: hypothetical protein M3Y27_26295 [Acidobacteriota bacterium]|nr:hypothetical protein [Acidobacteriota bacterium]
MNLTIFDMVDLLETEIAALRVRNQELQLAIEQQRQIDAAATAVKKRKAPVKKKTTKGQQLPLPTIEEEAKPEQETRTLGKRLALGKSLVQLRRVSAPRTL